MNIALEQTEEYVNGQVWGSLVEYKPAQLFSLV